MAEAGNTSKAFIFGQKMEERGIKPDAPDSQVNEPGTVSMSAPRLAFAGPATGILAPSKLAGNPFAVRPTQQSAISSSTPNTSDSDDEKRSQPSFVLTQPKLVLGNKIGNSGSPFELKPSRLSGQNTNSESITSTGCTFVLKPAKLPSPHNTTSAVKSKADTTQDDSGSEKDDDKDKLSEKNTPEVASSSESEKPSSSAEEVPPLIKKKEIVSPAFAAASTSENLSKESAAESSNKESGFVFGTNMSDRATNFDTTASGDTDASVSTPADSTEVRVPSPSSPDDCDTPRESPDKNQNQPKTLEESANEYQARLTKIEYQEVETVTGEEDESNVLQLFGKLFLFDKDKQNWLERGRGTLRLNDRMDAATNSFHSRIVMRTQGSLRVILNTVVWPGMLVERASQKSVRITAQCEESVKVFMILCSSKDADHFCGAVDWRVQQLRATEESAKPKPELEKTEKAVGLKRPAEKEETAQIEHKKLKLESESADFDPDKPREPKQDEGSNDSIKNSASDDPETGEKSGSD